MSDNSFSHNGNSYTGIPQSALKGPSISFGTTKFHGDKVNTMQVSGNHPVSFGVFGAVSEGSIEPAGVSIGINLFR